MIVQGTTPCQSFKIPFEKERIRAGYATIEQNGKVVLEIGSDRWQYENGYVSIKLAQEETFKLSYGQLALFQITIQLTDGDVFKSEEATQRVTKSKKRRPIIEGNNI